MIMGNCIQSKLKYKIYPEIIYATPTYATPTYATPPYETPTTLHTDADVDNYSPHPPPRFGDSEE